MAAPSVTTLSGRLTQISVIETRSLVVGIRPEAVVGDGKSPESMANSGPFRTAALPFGPVLEVIPIASADSPTIELDVKFSLTEFLGYEQGSPAGRRFWRGIMATRRGLRRRYPASAFGK